jgi:hypothetical protein
MESIEYLMVVGVFVVGFLVLITLLNDSLAAAMGLKAVTMSLGLG